MLTVERLRQVLDYDLVTGRFTWKVKIGSGNRGDIGKRAGCVDMTHNNGKGRALIGIDCKQYLAHRLAWAYVYGEWPDKQIDHIDGNPLNNCLRNLRLATNIENHQNYKSAKKDNKSSGLLGVSVNAAGNWRARIWVNKKEVHLGTFKSREEAYSVYISAKRKFHSHGTL